MGLFNRVLLGIFVLGVSGCGGDRFGTALFFDAGAGAGDALVELLDASDGDLDSGYLDSSYRHDGDVLEHEPDASDDARSVGPDAAERPDVEAPPLPDAGPPPAAVCCWWPGVDAGPAAAQPCMMVVISSTYTSRCVDGVACIWVDPHTGSGYSGSGAPCP